MNKEIDPAGDTDHLNVPARRDPPRRRFRPGPGDDYRPGGMDGTLPDPEWIMVGVPVGGTRRDGGQGRKRLYASKEVVDAKLTLGADGLSRTAWGINCRVMRNVLIITEDTYSECLAKLMEIWQNGDGPLALPAAPGKISQELPEADEVVEGVIVDEPEPGDGVFLDPSHIRAYADQMLKGGFVTPKEGEDASSFVNRVVGAQFDVPPPSYPHVKNCIWPAGHLGPCHPRAVMAGDPVTKTGKVLGPEEMAELTAEAERGYDVTGSRAYFGDFSGPEVPVPRGLPIVVDEDMADGYIGIKTGQDGPVTMVRLYDGTAPDEEDDDHGSPTAEPAERPGPGGDRGDEHPADPAV